MFLNDFHFELPDALIARYPLAKRSESRLLCLSSKEEIVRHQQFKDITHLLMPGDLLVFNNTKVIPARLLGKKMTGGRVEILIERILDAHRILVQLRASKSPKVGDQLLFGDYQFAVLNKNNQFYELNLLSAHSSVMKVIELLGQIPIPPYMTRFAETIDLDRYQTVYAKTEGSVAAPTAGLHFDEELLQQLKQQQVEMVELTLHIGAGTFLPVRTQVIEAHQMHAEYFEMSAAVCEKIKTTRAQGKRIIAVGTTSLRALESMAIVNNFAEGYAGETQIFIYPGFNFRCVDVLITNFHLPCSSLLMLVAAFGGYANIMQAYQEAIKLSYRFYSYGDAMWVEKS